LANPEKLLLIMQIQAWQDEVDRARQGQRDAEEKLSLMEVCLLLTLEFFITWFWLFTH